MPELTTRYGCYIARAAIIILGMSLFAFFKRRQWLRDVLHSRSLEVPLIRAR
jgi:hypothetical protein